MTDELPRTGPWEPDFDGMAKRSKKIKEAEMDNCVQCQRKMPTKVDDKYNVCLNPECPNYGLLQAESYYLINEMNCNKCGAKSDGDNTTAHYLGCDEPQIRSGRLLESECLCKKTKWELLAEIDRLHNENLELTRRLITPPII